MNPILPPHSLRCSDTWYVYNFVTRLFWYVFVNVCVCGIWVLCFCVNVWMDHWAVACLLLLLFIDDDNVIALLRIRWERYVRLRFHFFSPFISLLFWFFKKKRQQQKSKSTKNIIKDSGCDYHDDDERDSTDSHTNDDQQQQREKLAANKAKRAGGQTIRQASPKLSKLLYRSLLVTVAQHIVLLVYPTQIGRQWQ